MKPKAALYLFPVGLSEEEPAHVIPPYNMKLAAAIRVFVVENIRTARRWLRRCDSDFNIDAVEFFELNKHTSLADVSAYLEPLRRGEPIGVMSEAGCPSVADPGSVLVAMAHKEGLPVVPLVGPSSILLSLMASGFNGQSFCFHGYLPIDDRQRRTVLKHLEKESGEQDRTQIFIETPYRNNKLVEFLLENLHDDTMLCVAAGLTSSDESIKSMPIWKWKREKFDYAKIPAIFLIYRNNAGTGSVKTRKR